nr:uncharacterized protein LOC117996007 [Maniola hyperantus]
MKGIRNNLLNKNLMFTQDGKQKVAKWQHLEEMYHRQPGYKGVRLVPKLTAQHVVPKLIPKMKVKHCTQVFSRTVGVALGYMADCGQLPAENKDTADLLILMDELFDSVNGSYSKIRNGKIYRTAVTPKSPHHQLWRKSLPVLKSMVFVTKDGRKASVPSISSWIKTIEGFQLLINHLKSLNVTSLLLRHFNQDPLENFFGAIRAQGHSNNMPNAYGFQAAYKTLMVNNLTSPHSVGANCEKDGDFCLNNLKNLIKSSEKSNEENTENIEIDFNDLNIENINTNKLIEGKSPTDVERCAAVAYCSGWLVTKVQKKSFQKLS